MPKASTIAKLALATQAAMAPKANAGPVSYTACVVGCEAFFAATTGPGAIAALQACINACVPVLLNPLLP